MRFRRWEMVQLRQSAAAAGMSVSAWVKSRVLVGERDAALPAAPTASRPGPVHHQSMEDLIVSLRARSAAVAGRAVAQAPVQPAEPPIWRPGMPQPPAGSVVRVFAGRGQFRTVTVPAIDAEGNLIPS